MRLATLRARAFAVLALDHPAYFAKLLQHYDAWLSLPADMDRLEVIRLPDGAVVAFTWCYCEGNLLNPPAEHDWAKTRGRAIWVSDMVAQAGTNGARAARAVIDTLLMLGIATEGQRVHCWLNASARYGAVVARRRRGSVGGLPEVLFPKSPPEEAAHGFSLQAGQQHIDGQERPVRDHAPVDEGQPAEG
jgi:hypothetical protein